jgi:hypothetical protein
MCVITVSSLLINLVGFLKEGNLVLLVVDACLLLLAGWLLVEAVLSITSISPHKKQQTNE